MSLFTKPLGQFTDIEVEEALKLLEMDIRWSRNQAYALPDSRSAMIMKSVKKKEAQLRKLWSERERRIVQGRYHPFTLH